jgi:DNA polymerase (family 10)
MLADLEQAARAGKLQNVHGIGETLERRILRGCAEQRRDVARVRLDQADAQAAPLVDWMRKGRGVDAIEVAGSVRRRRETIGDLDVLVASRKPAVVADRFVAYPDVASVVAHGDTKCAMTLRSGLQVDLRIVTPGAFGAALAYFTGSKDHSIAIRTLGSRRELKINEYGVFRGEKRIGGRTEEEVYASVGLPWIPPELREDRGEIDAARTGTLPVLVELTDVRGDLHVHADAGEGAGSLRDMLAACTERGYAYLGIADALDRAGILGQRRAVERLQRAFPAIAILRGAEVGILDDGQLALDDETLDELDFVIATPPEARATTGGTDVTTPVLRAIAHPRVRILARPTGRVLGHARERPIDMAKVARAARDRGVLLEIDAQPERLDLSDTIVRMAREAGARFVVGTDARRVSELDVMRYGIGQARRAGCAAKDVANTWPLDALRTAINP